MKKQPKAIFKFKEDEYEYLHYMFIYNVENAKTVEEIKELILKEKEYIKGDIEKAEITLSDVKDRERELDTFIIKFNKKYLKSKV
jgi:hypothetical protein